MCLEEQSLLCPLYLYTRSIYDLGEFLGKESCQGSAELVEPYRDLYDLCDYDKLSRVGLGI